MWLSIDSSYCFYGFIQIWPTYQPLVLLPLVHSGLILTNRSGSHPAPEFAHKNRQAWLSTFLPQQSTGEFVLVTITKFTELFKSQHGRESTHWETSGLTICLPIQHSDVKQSGLEREAPMSPSLTNSQVVCNPRWKAGKMPKLIPSSSSPIHLKWYKQ